MFWKYQKTNFAVLNFGFFFNHGKRWGYKSHIMLKNGTSISAFPIFGLITTDFPINLHTVYVNKVILNFSILILKINNLRRFKERSENIILS